MTVPRDFVLKYFVCSCAFYLETISGDYQSDTMPLFGFVNLFSTPSPYITLFSHVETTCQALRVILKNFAQLIRQTLDGPSLPGVDLMREERSVHNHRMC